MPPACRIEHAVTFDIYLSFAFALCLTLPFPVTAEQRTSIQSYFIVRKTIWPPDNGYTVINRYSSTRQMIYMNFLFWLRKGSRVIFPLNSAEMLINSFKTAAMILGTKPFGISEGIFFLGVGGLNPGFLLAKGCKMPNAYKSKSYSAKPAKRHT